MTKETMVMEFQLVKSLVYYAMVVILGGLFISCIVEGLRQQFVLGNGSGGTLLYIVGLASLVSGMYVYKKGKLLISVE